MNTEDVRPHGVWGRERATAKMPATRTLQLPLGQVELPGDLAIPDAARGVVLFAHGSGSSRLSPRNRQIAAALQHAGLATMLLDLLTEEEERADRRGARLRFDIELLGERLTQVVDWLGSDHQTAALPLGVFGASTGAGAALIAAANRPGQVRGVVSRGGRPDLAAGHLPAVRASVLLIVGGADLPVLELNERAARRLASHELVTVPGATHLFEEPGALERVSDLAATWFRRHLDSSSLDARNGPSGPTTGK
jgi:dienelactone hydrolase